MVRFLPTFALCIFAVQAHAADTQQAAVAKLVGQGFSVTNTKSGDDTTVMLASQPDKSDPRLPPNVCHVAVRANGDVNWGHCLHDYLKGKK